MVSTRSRGQTYPAESAMSQLEGEFFFFHRKKRNRKKKEVSLFSLSLFSSGLLFLPKEARAKIKTNTHSPVSVLSHSVAEVDNASSGAPASSLRPGNSLLLVANEEEKKKRRG